MNATEVFDALPGTWHLERRLEPDLGTMTGTARFTRTAPDRIRYDEAGTLRLAQGYTGEASRSYDYRLVEGGIDVCFAEDHRAGATMHELRFGAAGTVTAVHHCAPDVYTGTYELRLPDEIVVTIEVAGPRKAYTSITRLRARRRGRVG